ncbi:unnamed protein product [Ascophyllum nodosum]
MSKRLVRRTYKPGSHRRKVILQDFSSTFFLLMGRTRRTSGSLALLTLSTAGWWDPVGSWGGLSRGFDRSSSRGWASSRSSLGPKEATLGHDRRGGQRRPRAETSAPRLRLDMVAATGRERERRLARRGGGGGSSDDRQNRDEELEEPWPIKTYDGPRVEQYYSRRPLAVLERFLRIGPPLLAWYAQQQLDKRTASFLPEHVAAAMNMDRATELRKILADSGSVTFVKSGQALSLRGDLVKNREYVKELEKLQARDEEGRQTRARLLSDEVGTFPNSVAFRIIEEDLGAPAQEFFDFVYPDPVASASIGQVYKARVRRTGALVAVKVQRPDAFRSAAVDMYLLRRFARWFKRVKKLRSDMVGVADEFGRQLFNELDYVQEAYNCVRFKELYGKIPGIYVPGVDLSLTTRRVLVQEWVEGEKGPWEQDGERLLTIGLQCSVLQVLDSGFFHADPHRGNLLRTPEGNLAYLDFGMMASVTSEKRYALIGATLGLQNRDMRLIAGNLVTMGFLPDETNVATLAPALENAIADASGGEGASKLNFTRLNENIASLSEVLTFRVPPFYSLVVRTLTILEGLALYVDPDFRLIKGAYPYIAKQILTENKPEMVSLMKSTLITTEGTIAWRRLEQLVTISGAAKVATTKQEFQELKAAQAKSDVQKKFAGGLGEVDPEVNLDLTISVLSFLLSDNGLFLREPLINELLDTMDELGAASYNLASSATLGLLPRSREASTQKKLDAVLGVVQRVIENSAANEGRRGGGGRGAVSTTYPQLQKLFTFMSEVVSDPRRRQQLGPVLDQLGDFAREVFARIVERQATNVVRSGFGLIDAAQAFPALADVLDAVSPPPSQRRSFGRPLRGANERERRP